MARAIHNVAVSRERDVWRASVEDAFPGTRVRFGIDGRARWTHRAIALGTVALHDIRAGAQQIESGTARGARTYSLLVQLEGRCSVAHARGRVELGAGQAVLVDVSERLELAADDAYRQAFALLPALELGALPRSALGRATDAESPTDRMLVQHVALLAEAAPVLDARQRGLALDALLATLRLSTPIHASLGARTSTRIERALAYVDEHLHDPDLDAAEIAGAQGIGRRHLDSLFAETGRSVTQTLWARRLDRAAHRLRAPDHARESVLEIAVGCGFTSASHFARVFRARFGTTPARWRRS